MIATVVRGTGNVGRAALRAVDAHPALKPHRRPPVIVGGSGSTRTPTLAARFADEFRLPFIDEDTAAAHFVRVDEACAAIGRAARPRPGGAGGSGNHTAALTSPGHTQ